MVVSPRTGSNAYILYGWEDGYTGSVAELNRAFGAKTAITTLTLTNNRIDIGKLGQVETATYAYGTQSGSVGVSFVLCDTITSSATASGLTETSCDIFRGIYGAPLVVPYQLSPLINAINIYPSVAGATITTTVGVTNALAAAIGQGKAPKTIESLTIDVGFNASDDGDDLNVRTLKGCILNSLALSTSIGETINCTADFSYGDEDTPTKQYSDFVPTTAVGTPYTFAHTELKVWSPSAATPALTLVQLVQDFDITFTNNAELLYGLGSHQAVDQFRKALDITGKFKIPVTDYVLLWVYYSISNCYYMIEHISHLITPRGR